MSQQRTISKPFSVSGVGLHKGTHVNVHFKPAEIIKQLNLLRPIYRNTTNYGHFGRVDDLDALTWERTDKAEALKKVASWF